MALGAGQFVDLHLALLVGEAAGDGLHPYRLQLLVLGEAVGDVSAHIFGSLDVLAEYDGVHLLAQRHADDGERLAHLLVVVGGLDVLQVADELLELRLVAIGNRLQSLGHHVVAVEAVLQRVVELIHTIDGVFRVDGRGVGGLVYLVLQHADAGIGTRHHATHEGEQVPVDVALLSLVGSPYALHTALHIVDEAVE